ncbi:hypothetical protein ACX800_14520 [Paenarthrobacter nitroguajacolicus]
MNSEPRNPCKMAGYATGFVAGTAGFGAFVVVDEGWLVAAEVPG